MKDCAPCVDSSVRAFVASPSRAVSQSCCPVIAFPLPPFNFIYLQLVWTKCAPHAPIGKQELPICQGINSKRYPCRARSSRSVRMKKEFSACKTTIKKIPVIAEKPFVVCGCRTNPVIVEKPLVVCGCRKFKIDALGDHLCTCMSHSGAKKAHDWAVDQLADLFRTTHKVKTLGGA
jgi:hypothetical protein